MNPSAFANRLWLIGGVTILVLLWTLSLMPHPPAIDVQNGDKYGHLAMYGGTMWWWGQYWTKFRQRLALAIIFALMGVAIEFIQGWSGWRSFEVMDMLANSVGVLLGWALVYTPLGSLLALFTGLTKQK